MENVYFKTGNSCINFPLVDFNILNMKVPFYQWCQWDYSGKLNTASNKTELNVNDL